MKNFIENSEKKLTESKELQEDGEQSVANRDDVENDSRVATGLWHSLSLSRILRNADE